MPSIVVATATNIVAHITDVRPEEALEQAQTASAGFPEATDVWLFDAVGQAPWHVSLEVKKEQKVRKGRVSL
jgi:hypothetical protein